MHIRSKCKYRQTSQVDVLGRCHKKVYEASNTVCGVATNNHQLLLLVNVDCNVMHIITITAICMSTVCSIYILYYFCVSIVFL